MAIEKTTRGVLLLVTPESLDIFNLLDSLPNEAGFFMFSLVVSRCCIKDLEELLLEIHIDCNKIIVVYLGNNQTMMAIDWHVTGYCQFKELLKPKILERMGDENVAWYLNTDGESPTASVKTILSRLAILSLRMD